jgi:flagellar motor switch protein FliN/FliY
MSETQTNTQATKDELERQPKAQLGASEQAQREEHEKYTSHNTGKGRNVDALLNVKLDVRIVLGHNRMPVAELLKLTRGSVIELDRKVGDPVDIMINDRLVARGDLVKIEGDMIGVALREIVKDFAPAD